MKRSVLIFALVLIVAMAVSQAQAVERSAGLWHVTHVNDPASGKFNYCAVESGFDNGLYLAFARNRDFNTNIVVSFPDKRLEEHAKYQMMVGIDSNPVRDMTAFAADPGILVIPLQHDRKILGWLENGKLLDLEGPQDSVKFSLDGAGDALHKLQLCVEQSLKEETVKGATPSHVTPGAAAVSEETASVQPGDVVEPLPLPQPQHEAAAPEKPLAATESTGPDSVPPAEAVSSAPPPAIPPPPPPAKTMAAPQAAPVSPPAQTIVQAAIEPETMQKPAAAVQPQDTVTASAPAPLPAPAPVPAMAPTPTPMPEPQKPARLSIAALLASAGLHPAGKCTDTSESCAWSNGGILGSVTQANGADSFLDAMMNDADRRETKCKGRFTSAVGAPEQRHGVMLAEATFTCDQGKAKISETLLYLQGEGRMIAVAETAPPAYQDMAVRTRNQIEAALPLATNYK
jgi:hypothetical protein